MLLHLRIKSSTVGDIQIRGTYNPVTHVWSLDPSQYLNCINSIMRTPFQVTYESPPGVKKNLLRTYEAWSPKFIEKGHQPVRAQALFTLAWFHAIIQERRNFIPQVHFPEFSPGPYYVAPEEPGPSIENIWVNRLR